MHTNTCVNTTYYYATASFNSHVILFQTLTFHANYLPIFISFSFLIIEFWNIRSAKWLPPSLNFTAGSRHLLRLAMAQKQAWAPGRFSLRGNGWCSLGGWHNTWNFMPHPDLSMWNLKLRMTKQKLWDMITPWSCHGSPGQLREEQINFYYIEAIFVLLFLLLNEVKPKSTWHVYLKVLCGAQRCWVCRRQIWLIHASSKV